MQKPVMIVFAAGLVLALVVGSLLAQEQPQASYNTADHRTTMIRLVGDMYDASQVGTGTTSIFDAISASDDPLYIAPLIDVAYFVRGGGLADGVFDTLRSLTGEAFGNDWRAWFEWASASDVELPPHYGEFKALLFATFIDPEFQRFFPPDVMADARVNLLEAVWGGVRVDGIPSLVNARQITPAEAAEEGERLRQFCNGQECAYPAPDELVFGVSIDGDNRAYPLRLLNWHEMFNDVVGHAPLYDAPDGESVCNFRAPTEFSAVARSGEDWVQIVGYSAGCAEGGWLANPAGLNWADDADWQALPDMAEGGEALDTADGIAGSVPGKPVMLAYCTLCGSGILYDVTVSDPLLNEGAETVLEFGSTGMLMRSNKLMYDRNTDTVWNALTGAPAFGALASSDLQLTILPVVVTDWATWLAEHPDSSVLSLETGYNRDYINGGAYTDYFNDPNFIMFPVWQQDTSVNENKEVVFTLIIDDTPKAYPLDLLIPETVTNDALAGVDVVIISRATPERSFFEPGGAAVRAYERGEYSFSPGDNEREVVDENGVIWQVTEDALISTDGDTLPRLGGHLAFWFGWYSFHPDTLVYEG
jgi:hypothetical protein